MSRNSRAPPASCRLVLHVLNADSSAVQQEPGSTLPRVAVRSVPDDASAVLMDSLHSARNTRNASFCSTGSSACVRALWGVLATGWPPGAPATAGISGCAVLGMVTLPGSCSRGVDAPLSVPFASGSPAAAGCGSPAVPAASGAAAGAAAAGSAAASDAGGAGWLSGTEFSGDSGVPADRDKQYT